MLFRSTSIFKDIKFVMEFNGMKPTIEQINRVLKKNDIDIFVCLCDLMKFNVPFLKNTSLVKFNRFYCTSMCWWPCHYYPFDEYSARVLPYFDVIITLCPSIKDILVKKPFFPNQKIVYIPHVIDFQEIVSSEKEFELLRNNLHLPRKGEKWICLINAMNYEVSCRKSFDTSLMAFKKFYDKYPDKAYLVINSSNSTSNEPIQIKFKIPDTFKIGETLYVQIPNKNKKIPIKSLES